MATAKASATLPLTYTIPFTAVSIGLGVAITPVVGPLVLWGLSLRLINRNAGSSNTEVTINIYRTTGSIPAQGSPPGSGHTLVKIVSIKVAPQDRPTISLFHLDGTATGGINWKYYVVASASLANMDAKAGWIETELYAFELAP